MPRRPKKGKSSDLLLRKLIGKLDHIETSLLRERIVKICEMGKQDMILNPDKYKYGIISPTLLESFYDKCLYQLSYDNKDSAEKNPTNMNGPEFQKEQKEQKEVVIIT